MTRAGGGGRHGPPPFLLWLRELPYTLPIVVGPLLSAQTVEGAKAGEGQPVLVFPGILSSDSATALRRRTLDRAGYRAYPSKLGLITGITPTTMAREEKQQKVVLLGWSLGGVYARVRQAPSRSGRAGDDALDAVLKRSPRRR